MTARSVSLRLRRASRATIFPFLAAVYPIVALYALNLREMVPLEHMLGPALIAIGATAAALALLRLLLRDWARAGLMALVLVVLFFTYGAALDVLAGALPVGHRDVLALWGALAVTAFVVVRALPGHRLAAATPVLNLVMAVLLAGNAVAVTNFQLAVYADAREASDLPAGASPSASIDEAPDIYWIILDRYGSEAVVREYYDHDISPFLDALRERGFYIAEEATANYLKTAASLVSARNMDYLDGEDLRSRASAGDDWSPLYRDLVSSFTLLDVLRPLGYRFVYLGTYWEFTATHPEADVEYAYDGATTEFTDVLADSTMLRAAELLGEDAAFDPLRKRWRLTRHQWEALHDASRLGGPKLVHAHFALPHEPYVFHADGSFVPADVAKARSTAENYADQVEYANAEVLRFVDDLLAADPEHPPIIVIQGEEGPFPLRFRVDQAGFSWAEQATDEELHEKFGVMSAFHLPGLPGERAEEAGLYPSVTLVNQFRVILNHYLGMRFEILPDRNLIWPQQSDLYRFIDVTERVRRMVDDAD
jgi:hypothetical protein